MPGLTTAFAQGVAASRPAAASSNAGYCYFATDTGILSQSTGSSWTTIGPAVALDALTTKADLLTRTSSAYSRLGVGSDAQVLTADSTASTGLKWATPASGFSDPLTTRGDLIVRGASSTGRLALGSSGQYLKSDGTDAVWAVAGAVSWATKTGTYTLLATDTGILADASGGAFTLTLPTAVGSTALYTIRKKDSSAGAVTITTTSSQTIDGATSLTLVSQGSALQVMSDGSNWLTCIPRGVIGYASITSSFTTATTGSYVDVTSLSVTVTVGGRPLRVSAFCGQLDTGTGTSRALFHVYDSTAGAEIAVSEASNYSGGYQHALPTARVAPAAGSRSYKVQVYGVAGTAYVGASATSPAYLLVEEL